jgi:hypothetical protein
MKPKIWKLLVATVLFLTLGSYVFIFRENQDGPTLWNIPFIFWTSFVVSALVVLATFVGSRVFPQQEENNK